MNGRPDHPILDDRALRTSGNFLAVPEDGEEPYYGRRVKLLQRASGVLKRDTFFNPTRLAPGLCPI